MKSLAGAMRPFAVSPSRGRAAGFTMVEMVMVIGIMLFLLGVLIVVVANVQAMSQKKATYLLVDAIESALVEYYNVNGEYPDLTELTIWPGYFGPAQKLYWELTCAEKGSCMKDIPSGMTRKPVVGSDNYYFVDSWQNPIWVFIFPDESLAARQNGSMPFVWSWGPNGNGWNVAVDLPTTPTQSMSFDLENLVSGTTERDQDNLTNFRDIPVDNSP